MLKHFTIQRTAAAAWRHVPATGKPRRWPLCLLVGCVLPAYGATPDPATLPGGGKVTAGAASIIQSPGRMQVQQSTARAVIDWQTFNLGAQATLNFQQPSATSVTLNRVHDSQPSQIFGQITANGQVYLVNPAGLYFSPTASVDVGALVAGTHGMSDADFMAGKTSFMRSGATGSVINDGSMRAGVGGYIALLAPQVRNGGVIVAQAGTVVLAAGEAIALQFDGDTHLARVVVQAADIQALVENRQAVLAPGGTIILSAQAADRLQGGVVKNSGSLEASGLVSHGGRIFLEASDQISHSGSIKADAAGSGDGGTVSIVASLDNRASSTDISGTISARGGARSGDGGTVDTSGSRLHIGADVTVDTRAFDGNNGTWLLDPGNVVVGANGDMRGATLGANLALGNVTLQSSAGAGAGAGDIIITDNVAWSANNALTLSASNDVRLLGKLNASGATAGLHILPNTANGPDAASGQGAFKLEGGSVTLSGSAPRLSIGGASYTVINQLGAPGSTTQRDLQGISGNVSGNYALGSDIDASATASWNGGAGFAPLAGFSGTFDGLGHTVSSLTIQRADMVGVGLFGDTAATAVLRNIGLVNASISGRFRVGSLVGTNGGAVSNSYASATVTATGFAGGLVGHNDGAIAGSSSQGVVHADRAGGLVGDNFGQISSSSSSSDVIGNGGTQGNSGGLAATNFGGVINASFATGNVIAAAQRAGGLVGYSSGTIHASHAGGNVESIGEMAGGLVGWNDNGSVNASFATGKVSGTNSTGGLVGYSRGSISISNSHATGNVAGTNFVGGLVGLNETGLLDHSYATGHVAGTLYVGGLAGANDEGRLDNTYATGDVAGTRYVGGLVGLNNIGRLTSSYATGNVHGVKSIGGLLGHGNGTIADAYATGNVDGTENVGGLVGTGIAGLDIANTYASGRVSGASSVGGLAGKLTGATVSASYWDTTSTGQANSAGGTGLSSAQLRQAVSFQGWDLAASWIVYEGLTSPLLRSFMTPLTVTANNVSKTYDGLAYTGAAIGLTYSSTPNANLLGTADYRGATDAGLYRLGLYSTQQGYAITIVNGVLTIDPRTVNLSGARVYDASTSMPASALSLSNLVGTQTLGLSGLGSVPSKNVAAGTQAIALGTLALSDGSGRAANYTLAGGTHTASITPATLNVTGVTATDKTYDANPETRLAGKATVSPLPGDAVTLGGDPLARFADASVGNAKPVTVTGFELGGADAANYQIRQPGGLAATILPAPLAVPAPAVATPSAQAAPVSMVVDADPGAAAGIPAVAASEPAANSAAATPAPAGSTDSADAATPAAAVEAATASATPGAGAASATASAAEKTAVAGQAVPTASGTPASQLSAKTTGGAARRASTAAAAIQAAAAAMRKATAAALNSAAGAPASGARVALQSRLVDHNALTSFQGSNKFSCLNADLSACAGKQDKGMAALGPIDQQKAAQMAAFDVMTESFDQIPSRHNAGIKHVGKTKASIQFNETSENVNLVNMILLFL